MPIIINCAFCGKPFETKPYVALRPRPCCSIACANLIKTTNPIKRFWSKVDKRGDDECWNWLGYKDKDGYGTFNPTSKKLIKAHRFAYTLTYGEIKSGQCICHKCDNPPCCNPEHLFIGTFTDNDADRDKKGRQAYGERSGRTNFTTNDIIHIRKLRNNGMSEADIAQLFGASQTGISSIVLRRTWKHI